MVWNKLVKLLTTDNVKLYKKSKNNGIYEKEIIYTDYLYCLSF